MELLFLTINTNGLVELKGLFFVMKLKEYSYLDILYVFLYINIFKVIFSSFKNILQRSITKKTNSLFKSFSDYL